jgi:thioredoxin-related protein
MLKANTFTDKDVAAYFNANYICVSLDGEKGDGATLAARYHIPGYPTLMLFNKNGEPVTTETGYLEPADLLDFGKQAVGK